MKEVEIRKVANGYMVIVRPVIDRRNFSLDNEDVRVFETFDGLVVYLRSEFENIEMKVTKNEAN